MIIRSTFFAMIWAFVCLASARAETASVSPTFEAQAASPAGCWQTRTQLYRMYVVVFCLRDGGAGLYRVQGDGYDCQGSSAWSVNGSRFSYQMQRGFCRPGRRPAASWTADRIDCEAVPNRAGDLACVYYPNAPGGSFSPSPFAAARREG